MTIQKLEKDTWTSFCNGLSRRLLGKRAEVEVASLLLGDQIAAEWLPLLGIAYDPKNDVIEIALENLDHLIHRPREFYVDIGEAGPARPGGGR